MCTYLITLVFLNSPWERLTEISGGAVQPWRNRKPGKTTTELAEFPIHWAWLETNDMLYMLLYMMVYIYINGMYGMYGIYIYTHMCIYILYTIIYIRWTCAINVLYICYIRVTYVLCLCYVGYVCVSVVHVLHVDMIYVYVICVCTYIHPSGHLT